MHEIARTPTRTKTAPRPHSTLALGLTIAVAAGLLAACSAIPPQSVTDPLGLDSQQLALQFAAADGAATGVTAGVTSSANVSAQAVPGKATSTFEFADWDVNVPVNPGTLSNAVSIKSAALSPATTDTAPLEITLADPELTVRVWQGAVTYEDAAVDDRVEIKLAAAGAITLERTGTTCVIAGGGTCPYSYAGDSEAFGVINLSGSALGSLFNVATEAPSPNSGSVSLTVQGEPDGLVGKTLTITLAAAEGTVGF